MIADRVREISTSTGTGALTLSGAVTAYESFNTAFGIGPSFDYCIEVVDDATGMPTGSWEIGRGHLSGATTLVRDAVQQSSNADALVPFGAGTKNVFCTLSASAINALAPLASPVFTGNPTAPTPTAGDNDTSIATTAFVGTAVSTAAVPPATVAPLMDGAAAVGTTVKFAREDHTHPSDTSRVAKAGDTMTGALNISATTASTSSTTGALTVAGGVGVGGKINALGQITSSGSVVSQALNSSSGSEFDCADELGNLKGGLYWGRGGNSMAIWNNSTSSELVLQATGQVTVSSTLASTSSTTGALTVAGGVGIAGSLNTGAISVKQAGTGITNLGQVGGSSNFSGIAFGASVAAVDVTTVSLMGEGTNTYVNALTGGAVNIRVNNSNIGTFNASGFVMGAPTGGAKGAGTINAVSVYDDNVLLTCVGVQYLKHGEVDLAQWDALSPVKHHRTAHRFVELVKTFDPRDPRQYIERMMADEALPGMPTVDEWRHGEASLGEMHNRLWLATELLAAAFVGLHNDYEIRLAALMQRVETLEKRT